MVHYGHILRKGMGCLEKYIIQGTTQNTVHGAGQKTTWLNNIEQWTGKSMAHNKTYRGQRTMEEERS